MNSVLDKARRIFNLKQCRVSFAWLTLVLAIITLEIFLLPYFVPTITMETPQDEKYLLPWKYTWNFPYFSVRIDLEVYDLVFPDRATPWVNDVVIYSFNITNLTNRTLEINHTLSIVNPIFESFENMSVTLENGTTKSLGREKVVFKNEGMNEVDIVFNITDDEYIRVEHYMYTVTRQTENSILFSKYGQILTLIILIPSTIIAIKNLKDLVLKSPCEEHPSTKG